MSRCAHFLQFLALCVASYLGSIGPVTFAEEAASGLLAEKPAADDATTEAAEPAPPIEHLSPVEVFRRMLPTTCWIRYEWVNNGMPYVSMGTGWVYDIGRRLVVTNEHVIHNNDAVTVYFPQEVDGELQHEPEWYVAHGEKFAATVMDRDTERDLALVQLEGLPDNAVALKLAEQSPPPGERIFALASLPEGSEGLWIMTTGEVRQVYKRSHANNHFARVVETQLPINRGNSGGAVVNDLLEVVAVVEGFRNDARLVSMFIDVNEVRDFLDESVPLLEPTTAEEYETRAARRYDEARYDQAIADYTAALKIDPKLGSAMMNRGWAYFIKEDYQTAMADFDAALKVDPELRGAYEGRGTCHRELGDYKTAIKDLTEAIRRDSTDSDTFERRAKCYVGLERHEDALKDRNRAVGLAPDDVDLLAQRAQTFRALKRFGEAQKDLEKAISLNPGQAWLYYELGHVFFDQESYPQAHIFFDIAVQRDNATPEYINMRGLTNNRMKQYEAAVADLNHAIALSPERPYYHWNLGIALWNLDRYPESLEAYSQYIRLSPDDPAGYNERADVYEAMGQDDQASADRAKAKQLKRKK
jgi:tetratricopeptide (TPR) repeat protein